MTTQPQAEPTTKNYKVKLISKARTNKDGFAKIEVQVMKYENQGTGKYEMVRKYVDTNIQVLPKHWNQKTQKISSKEVDHQTKQHQVNLVLSGVLNFVNSGGVEFPNAEGLKLDNLQDFFPKVSIKRKSLVKYAEDYHTHRVKQHTKRGTTKEFITIKNRIAGFDKWNKRTTYLEDINVLWSNSFEDYCRNEKKYSDGTIGKSYELLYTVLNYYYEGRDEYNIEMTDKFKYSNFKRGSKSINKPNPIFLNQLMTLAKHNFEKEHLEMTKKMILLQCYTGIRYDDIKRLRPEHFTTDGFLIFVPQKTNYTNKKKRKIIEVVQPLNNYAIPLLKEVEYDTSVYKYSNQHYNRNIEDIFDILREKYPEDKFETYTSHNFRDTFISNAVQASINWKSILKWVGQTSYSIMDRYIHLTPEFDKSEMNKMFKYMVVQGKIVYYKE